jgi:hypothetical protein
VFWLNCSGSSHVSPSSETWRPAGASRFTLMVESNDQVVYMSPSSVTEVTAIPVLGKGAGGTHHLPSLIRCDVCRAGWYGEGECSHCSGPDLSYDGWTYDSL